jgi:hypothetical protein
MAESLAVPPVLMLLAEVVVVIVGVALVTVSLKGAPLLSEPEWVESPPYEPAID